MLGLYGNEKRSPNSSPEHRQTPADKLLLRPYSIASARSDTQHFEFYVSQVKSGQLTPRLFNLEMSARLHVGNRIVGVFTLSDTPEDVDIVMVATGTGLAPYVSFLRSHIVERPKSKMVVIHGAMHTWDLGYYSELTFLDQAFANFKYRPTLTEADETWTGYRYWIEEIMTEDFFRRELEIEMDPKKTHFFLCGNPVMVDNVAGLLEKVGYTRDTKKVPGSLHVEGW